MTDDYTQQQKALVAQMEQIFVSDAPRPTLVEMQQDYAHDPRRCLTAVVLLPPDVTQIISQKLVEPLRGVDSSQYFFPPDSLHITIKNVRTIDLPPKFTPEQAQRVDQLFQTIIPRFGAIEFTIEDVLLFPTSVSVMSYTTRDYQRLVLALDQGLQRIGVPDNKRYVSDEIFAGNTTVCRFGSEVSATFKSAVHNLRNLRIGSFKAKTVQLVTCNAVCHPGSRTVIGQYQLR